MTDMRGPQFGEMPPRAAPTPPKADPVIEVRSRVRDLAALVAAHEETIQKLQADLEALTLAVLKLSNDTPSRRKPPALAGQ